MKYLIKVIAVLELLIGLSAIRGGYSLISGGISLPSEMLKNTPFDTFFWPGLILAAVVGGTYILAAIFMWMHARFSLEASAVAGFGLLIWLFTEVYMVGGGHFLQILYFIFGLLTLVLVMLFLKLGLINKKFYNS